ncbi:MAG: response regulator, partial [Bdellovibrionales bacterium]|nr:response regulator [Bdellovibrionales bacterium]
MTDKKYQILVVEDDEDARAALVVMLEGMNFAVQDYESGKAALADIANHSFDLALLDIMMPEMNGYELLEKIKLEEKYKKLPIIMVTAKDTDSEILEGYQYGADYYITKPFTA